MPQRKENIGKKEPRTIYRSRLLNTIQAIIISAFLLVYPLTACANEVPPPAIPDRLPSDIFILNDMRWVTLEHRGHNYYEETYDPETKQLLKRVYKNWTYITTFTNRKVSENKCELYSIAEVKENRQVIDYANKTSYGDDTTWTENYGITGWFTIEDNRVYWQPNQPEYDRELLYDFNLKVGEIFYGGGTFDGGYFEGGKDGKYPFTLISIDSILLNNGEYKKRYNFEYLNVSGGYSVIEGIGCNYNLFYPINVTLHHDENQPSTLEIYHKDRLIWSSELYWQGGI
ncbi:MAG: hypothetical protein FWG85_05245 [Bacteroidetes bacterium]|nr:hypothetical protein [Bacteroidota bacterium]